MEIRRFDRIPSTQGEAIRLARAGAATGTFVVAVSQSHGVGRLDHRWFSPPGGLYLSGIVPEPPEGIGWFPMAVAAELRRELGSAAGVSTGLRWPNDLWSLGPAPAPGKLAGVLLDRVERTGGAVLVVGIGLNVRPDLSELPDRLAHRVATLRGLSRRAIDLPEAEDLAIRCLDSVPRRLVDEGARRALAEECRSALLGIGRSVRVDGLPAGRIDGLTDDGALLIVGPSGPREIRAGSIEFDEGP